MTSKLRVQLGVAMALIGPPLLLCSPFLFSSRCLHGLDFDRYFRPHAIVAREAFRQTGDWPRWNPYQYAGTPFLGGCQASFYYPPYQLFLHSPPEEAVEFLVVAHLILASWGMYRLTRFFGLGRAPCVLAAVAYSISFCAMSRIASGHLTVTATQCQAPAFLFFLLGCLRKPRPARAAALAVALAAVLIAGHPQFVYHLGALSLAAAAWTLVERGRSGERVMAGAATVALAAALGVALSAVHLLPMLDVVARSARGHAASIYAGYGMHPDHAFNVANLTAFVIPSFGWSPHGIERMGDFANEKGVYIGVLPLALASAAFFGRRRAPAIFFAVAGIVALMDAMALALPVHGLLTHLPGYDAFRVPARAAWISSLSLCVLSAFGLEAISSGEASARRRWGTLIGVGVTAAGLAAFFALREKYVGESMIFLLLAGISIALMALARRPAARVAAILFVATDLCLFGWGAMRTRTKEEFAASPWYAKFIGEERREYRLMNLCDIHAPPMAHGFRLITGYGHPMLQALSDLEAQAWQDPVPWQYSVPLGRLPADPGPLEILNVRWIVKSGRPLDAPWRAVASMQGQTLYENPGARPASFFEEGGGEARLTRPSTDRLEVACRSDRRQPLVVSESWMPGWRAALDGAPVPVRESHGALMAVDVPPGESRVTLEYDPAERHAGRRITFGAALVLSALFGLALARRRNRIDAT